MSPFARRAAGTLALLGGLLALEQLHPSHRRPHVPAAVGAIVRDLVHHGPNEEDELGLQAGYYEELLNASNDATRKEDPEAGWKNSIRLDATHEQVRDFVFYRLKAGLDVEGAGGDRIRTNRFGLADRDVTEAKPAGTWRIAFLGDSLVRGLGAPFGRALEPRFEEWLGATQVAAPIGAYEVLNFGVEGYRLTQILDVACKRVPPFQPDAVLVGITDIGASRNFGNHVARLVHEGIDLEYPFLKELVARVGVTPEETIGEAENRLARVRRELLGDCLKMMRERAAALHAPLIAVLLPTVTESDKLAERFAEMRGLLQELAIPTLDLLDTFADATDLAPLRVSRVDHHPSERGYGMLLERLQQRLAADPATATLLLGHPVR